MRKRKEQNKYDTIMTENLRQLSDTKPQIQEARRKPSMIKTKKK